MSTWKVEKPAHLNIDRNTWRRLYAGMIMAGLQAARSEEAWDEDAKSAVMGADALLAALEEETS